MPVRRITFLLLTGFNGLVCTTETALASGSESEQCVAVGEVCIEPAGTRMINGIAVTRDCWAKRTTYECLKPTSNTTNGCDPLQSLGCAPMQDAVCTDGLCTQRFTCSQDIPPELAQSADIQIESTQTISDGKLSEDTRQCDALNTENTTCQVISQRCVDKDPTVRVINGRRYRKDCWGWERTMKCTERTVLGETITQFDFFEPGAKFISKSQDYKFEITGKKVVFKRVPVLNQSQDAQFFIDDQLLFSFRADGTILTADGMTISTENGFYLEYPISGGGA